MNDFYSINRFHFFFNTPNSISWHLCCACPAKEGDRNFFLLTRRLFSAVLMASSILRHVSTERKKFFKSLIFFLLFSIYIKANAQDSAIVVDTVITNVESITDTSLIFEKIYSQNTPVAVRSVPDTTVNKLRSDDAFWYANTSPQREKPQPNGMRTGKNILYQDWFKTLVWFIIIGSFVAILIWYLASSNIQLFRKNTKILIEEKELSEENIFDVDFKKEIEKAAASANYSLAIRLWYLQTLKELANKNIIEYRHQRTNSDYLTQLFSTVYYKDFFRLTRNFEYIWYGKFDLSAEGYSMMEKDFSNFKKDLQ